MPRKLNWGLVGGGEGSQIGGAHRIGARLDGHFELVAGALDIDPVRAREFAIRMGIAEERAYGDWSRMLGSRKEPRAGLPARLGDGRHTELHPP